MFTSTTIVQDQTRRSKLSFLKYGLNWRTYSRRLTLWLEVTPIKASTIESTHFSERQVTTSLGIYPKGILVFVYKSYAEYPGFHRFRAWGSLKFFIEHSLGERADYLLLLGDSVSQCILCLQRRNSNDPIFSEKKRGSFYFSVKLPTYPSPKPALTLSSYLGQNVGLGEG